MFRLATSGGRYPSVSRHVQDVLPVNGALAECRVAFGIEVVGVRRVAWYRGDAVLEGAEIGEEVGDAGCPLIVY